MEVRQICNLRAISVLLTPRDIASILAGVERRRLWSAAQALSYPLRVRTRRARVSIPVLAGTLL
jgi:hypothetical protein